MYKHLFSLAAFSLLASSASAQSQLWSQSTDNTTTTPGSIACQSANGITDNSYWRRYDPVSCGLAGDYIVTACNFAVEFAVEPATGMQPLTVNIRAANAAFPAGGSTDPILGTGTVMVGDTTGAQQFETVTFSPPVMVSAGTVISVELMSVDQQATPGGFFFPGSNGLGESGLGYISAAACGIADPTDYAAIGFPGVHHILDLECEPDVPTPLGMTTTDCPALPHSVGGPATVALFGTGNAGDDVDGTVSSGPPNEFGYFISGPNAGVIPAGCGLVCIGTPQFRYQAQLFQFDAAGNSQANAGGGAVTLPTDGSYAPVPAIAVGETRRFQAWFRDAGCTTAGQEYNFSDVVSHMFL